ncbi:mitofilin family membrane protein [Litorisediminicola beolgyonensis]|uniref:Mitofilin family membrane protein n=1 Tax=Litorisediminicola beolgyonensis TaxID=1173614 RepID=A0ABW3ZHT3_9RHOB
MARSKKPASETPKGGTETEAETDAKVTEAASDTAGDGTETRDEDTPGRVEEGEALTAAAPETDGAGSETPTPADGDISSDDPDAAMIDKGEALAPEGTDEPGGPAPETNADAPVAAETSDETEASRPGELPGFAPAPNPPVREVVVQRKGGFFPMLLGGVAAAALGFALSEYLGPQGWFGVGKSMFEDETRDAMAAQQQSLDTLSGRINGIETGLSEVDLTSVETAVADLVQRSGELGTQVTALKGRVDDMAGVLETMAGELTNTSSSGSALDQRLTALEKAPMEEIVSPETIAAYEREMARIQEAVESQRGDFESRIAAQQAEMEAQRAEIATLAERAVEAERQAASEARTAELRGAVAQLASAVDNGAPYAEELATLDESGAVEVPEGLSASAEEGVATLQSLVESFPDAARDALAAARGETPDSPPQGVGGVVSFFKSQLGARSVVPRDGDDPDAVLSRAEAAVRDGDLSTALSEISALPEAAQDAMADWTARAEARAAALTGAEALAEQLNSN